MGRRWRSWSPWRLREALRWQRDLLNEDRTLMLDDVENTTVERLFRHAANTLAGHSDPWEEACRYSVKGRTLCIDATKEGAAFECVVENGRCRTGDECPCWQEGWADHRQASVSGREAADQ